MQDTTLRRRYNVMPLLKRQLRLHTASRFVISVMILAAINVNIYIIDMRCMTISTTESMF